MMDFITFLDRPDEHFVRSYMCWLQPVLVPKAAIVMELAASPDPMTVDALDLADETFHSSLASRH
jgi:hypothetical protein